MRIFNRSNPPRKFKFRNPETGEVTLLGSGGFATLDEGYRADITFRTALQAGDIVEYENVNAARELEKQHAEEPVKQPKKPKTIEDAAKTAKKTEAKVANE